MRRLYRPYLLFVVGALLLLLTLPGTTRAADALQDRAGGERERVLVTLQADGLPRPDGITTLTLQATPLIAAPDLRVRWIVPEGVELLGEAEESFGAVAERQTVSAQRQVRFSAGGPFKVVAEAYYNPAESVRFAASGVLFFTVQDRNSQVSDKDPSARRPDAAPMPMTLERADVPALQSTTGDPCFTVSGTVTRIERTPTQSGFAPDILVPVRNVVMEMREEDTFSDDSYGVDLTDEDGNYAFSFCDDDGVFDDELELYVRLRAEIRRDNGDVISYVEDSSYIDEVYEFETGIWESEGGTYTADFNLDEFQSEVMNINAAVLDAYDFWEASGGAATGDDLFDYTTEVHYEPGYGDTRSYYNGDWNEITLADDPSNPDPWDDTVIIHEWGHQADDRYSCDGNPGGQHQINEYADSPNLAWGEGYPDYWQSAVRASVGAVDASFYLDINAAGGGLMVNLEPTQSGFLTSTWYEIAIAGALWDLTDTVNDGNDTVSYDHAMLQEVFTSETFADSDVCVFDTYLFAWDDLDKPTDAAVAATVTQNVGLTILFTQPNGAAPSPSAVNAPVLPGQTPLDSKWWNEVVWVVDNSPSMAGAKLNAVKTVLAEQANDLAAEPEGTEVGLETFNNADTTNDVVLAGQFFAETIQDGVNSITPSGGSDPNCTVNALRALSQAVEGRSRLDAWLFTDNNTSTSPSADSIRQVLNDREVRASFALLTSCTPVAAASPDALTEEETTLQAAQQNALQAYLGGAEEPPADIVPYLLTAIRSGGQFLYADGDNVDSIAEILRAQLTHSAGAGRWSDYVSDRATYRFDELASWEYDWIDTTGGTTLDTDLAPAGVTLPSPFTFYGSPQSSLFAYHNGYVTFGAPRGDQSVNTAIPNLQPPNNALYVYWDDLERIIPPALQAANAPQGTYFGYVRHLQDGDWYVIEYGGFGRADNTGGNNLTFEILLNLQTGEIRYQYLTVDNAGGATIGLENTDATDAVQVSFNDLNGASSGMGYKFTPAPPQPTKTYTVSVDSLMDGVGFLLTGYSGSFDPLVVRDPAGNAISCSGAGVRCLDLGLVQYVQVNVDDRVGDWTAEVGAGPTGGGTFGFTSFATSPITVRGQGDRNLPLGNRPFRVDFGLPLDGNAATGTFRLPSGTRFGTSFPFFDDGQHGDDAAGDGIFGTLSFQPEGAGTIYLGVEGTLDGVDFTRTDPIPYTFQPITVTPPQEEQYNYGDTTVVQFEVHNQDIYRHCYIGSVQVPEGWLASQGLALFCLNPNQSTTRSVEVTLGSVPNDLPSGTEGRVTYAVTELEQGEISDSASVALSRRRPAAEIFIDDRNLYIRPNGDIAPLVISVDDEEGHPVADGTEVQLTATMGTISPTVGLTEQGIVRAEFISGPNEGDATVTASVAGGSSASTTIPIRAPRPNQIALHISAPALPADGNSTTTAETLVRDRWGNPVASQTVRISVNGDGEAGTIDGQEVVTGTTDANGWFVATFTSGTQPGEAIVMAELLVKEGGAERAVHDTQAAITLQTIPTAVTMSALTVQQPTRFLQPALTLLALGAFTTLLALRRRSR